jgi:hypothetical protein
VVRSERGKLQNCDLDVGDRTRVRLINTDIDKGYIDFECFT